MKLQEDIKLLNYCIDKWESAAMCGEDSWIFGWCALCVWYLKPKPGTRFPLYCDGCPIRIKTGYHKCDGTPYWIAENAMEECEPGYIPIVCDAIEAEIEFLIDIRDELLEIQDEKEKNDTNNS